MCRCGCQSNTRPNTSQHHHILWSLAPLVNGVAKHVPMLACAAASLVCQYFHLPEEDLEGVQVKDYCIICAGLDTDVGKCEQEMVQRFSQHAEDEFFTGIDFVSIELNFSVVNLIIECTIVPSRFVCWVNIQATSSSSIGCLPVCHLESPLSSESRSQHTFFVC